MAWVAKDAVGVLGVGERCSMELWQGRVSGKEFTGRSYIQKTLANKQ